MYWFQHSCCMFKSAVFYVSCVLCCCPQGTLRTRGHLILMADADGATKFADVAKLEAGLQNLSPKPVSIISYRLKQVVM